MAYGSSSAISYLGVQATGAMEDGTGFAIGTKEQLIPKRPETKIIK